MGGYVCAFRGRRDNYQVPLALAEGRLLDQFITDFYAVNSVRELIPLLPKKLRRRVTFRAEPGIPLDKVKCLWGTSLLEHLSHAVGLSPASTYARLDPHFGHNVAVRARQTKSDLFLYTPYAWEAFTASYPFTPRKVLFEYHPHPDFQQRLLLEDLRKFPSVQQSYREETGEHLSSQSQTRIRDSWKHADLILCASSFTRQTVIEAGAHPKSCKVIPYGIDLPPISPESNQPEYFRALFVGTGIQRKGIHHLLQAWGRASLPKGSLLTLVCRRLDPGVEGLLAQTKNVELVRGASHETLLRLYQSSSLFVMPSLIEGFGQVFLEALSFGCPVLGTPNTCLPDMGDESDGIFLAEVGNIDCLAARIEKLASALPGNIELRRRARACAARFPWSSFRVKLIESIQASN